jgi:hypothetical protein
MLEPMPIDSDTAARVAKANGLSLSDARALSVLADDEGHAGRLAEQFKPGDPEPDYKALAREIDGAGF